MIRPITTLLTMALLAALVVGRPGPAGADQTDDRLDLLFAQLKGGDPGRAPALEHEIWQIWITSDDQAADRLMRQGIGAMANQEFAAARRVFDRLIERKPAFAEAWNKRATVHYLLGDFAASVADIRKTLELEPRHFGALSGLGLIYDALGEPEAALRSFAAALDINPHLSSTRERVEELQRELRGSRI